MPRTALLLGLLLLASPALAQEDIAAYIKSIDGDEVVLDRGSKAGVERRMVFDVYNDAKAVRLPLAGGDEDVYVPQKVIGRLVIRAVFEEEARAKILDTPKEPLRANLLALFNPTRRAPNQPPTFVSVAPVANTTFTWRESVEVRFVVQNEPSDELTFEWSCFGQSGLEGEDKGWSLEGGVLEARRTRVPTNTWIAPPLPGIYRIRVQARDSAGLKSESYVDYKCRGMTPASSLGSSMRHLGVAYEPNELAGIRDIAFDESGAMVVLQGGEGGFLGGGSPALKIFGPSGRLIESFNLPDDLRGSMRLAIDPSSIVLLDPSAAQVKRFARGGAKGYQSVLRGRPQTFGKSGTGNGKFARAVDLIIDSRGHICVLDQQQCSVQVFRDNGVFLYSVGMEGKEASQMQRPVALAAAPDGRIFCLDDGRKVVLVFKGGAFDRELRLRTRGALTGMAYDPFEDLLGISDLGAGALIRVKPESGEQFDARALSPLPTIARLASLKESGVVRASGTSAFVVVDREGKSLAMFTAADTVSEGPYGFLGRRGDVVLGDDLKIAASPQGDLVTLGGSAKLVTRINRQGWVDLQLGSEGKHPMKRPFDVAVNDVGKIYVLDPERSQVLQFTSKGYPQEPLGRPGEDARELNNCVDLDCAGQRRDLVILQERNGYNVFLMNPDGSGLSWPRNPSISDPVVATQDPDGKFWIIDDDVLGTLAPGSPNFSPSGKSFDEVTDITAAIDGTVFVADVDDGFIQAFRGAVVDLGKISNPRTTEPKDIAVDNYGWLFVFDASSGRVHILTP